MSMYNVLAVTNRHLCKDDFLEQIEKICILNNKIKNHISIEENSEKSSPHLNYNLSHINSISIVLREKDLCEENYEILAFKVLQICKKFNTECILHTYCNTAKKLGVKKIHVPLSVLKTNLHIIDEFDSIGVSIHSLEDALEAEKLGASYITAGHIFNTNCKKGLPGRGIDFLHSITNSSNIPVFAIGGISSSNIKQVIDTGAYGVCIMSGLMNIDDPEKFF